MCSEDLDLHWSESDSSLLGEDNLDTGTCGEHHREAEVVRYESEGTQREDIQELAVEKKINVTVGESDKLGREANDDSGDVFGDTISDSFLDRAMDQQQQQPLPVKLRRVDDSWCKRGELSPGMMLALGDMDSQVEFCTSISSNTFVVDSFGGQEISLARRRRRKKRKAAKKGKESLSPRMILSDDSESDGGGGVDLCVGDVCSNREIFTQFVCEWKARRKYSLAVAVDRCRGKPVEDRLVGSTRSASQAREQTRLLVDTGELVGLAVCWSGLDVFYISLQVEQEAGMNDTLAPPSQDQTISVQERLAAMSEVMAGEATVSALSWRRQASLLYSVTGKLFSGRQSDPAVAP